MMYAQLEEGAESIFEAVCEGISSIKIQTGDLTVHPPF
jgi:hypothetical protein